MINRVNTYRAFPDSVRVFISMWLAQELMCLKALPTLNKLQQDFNRSSRLYKNNTSNYWYKLMRGMPLRGYHRITAIEAYSPGITAFLCHPLCKILSKRCFLQKNTIRKMLYGEPEVISRQIYVIREELRNNSNSNHSVYVKTLDNLAIGILDWYFEMFTNNKSGARKHARMIKRTLQNAHASWHFPQSAEQLSMLVFAKMKKLERDFR